VRWVKTFLAIPILAILILFCFQNQERVTLRFLFIPIENYHWFEIPKAPLPLFVVVLCSIFVGIFIGLLGDVYRRFKLKKTLRQKQKTIERLEKEVQSLRGPDLADSAFPNKES
jgi:uncharacterized integral membrane protein